MLQCRGLIESPLRTVALEGSKKELAARGLVVVVMPISEREFIKKK